MTMCPDCRGWGYLDKGGPCPTCNGEGELPDETPPTKAEQPQDSIDSLIDELRALRLEAEASDPQEDEPPTFTELDADWWKPNEENDYGD
jgi:DnaJ-class molecular chaperone